MTKTELTSAIGTAITIVISRVKLFLGLSKIVDVVYPVAVTDSNTTETYTTKEGSAITYTITLIKHGNAVHISGNVTNTTNSALSGQDIFDWKNTEYKPITGTSQFFRDTAGVVDFTLRANSFGFASVFPPLSTYFFNYKLYIAQD